jgi:hypothetical protein
MEGLGDELSLFEATATANPQLVTKRGCSSSIKSDGDGVGGGDDGSDDPTPAAPENVEDDESGENPDADSAVEEDETEEEKEDSIDDWIEENGEVRGLRQIPLYMVAVSVCWPMVGVCHTLFSFRSKAFSKCSYSQQLAAHVHPDAPIQLVPCVY